MEQKNQRETEELLALCEAAAEKWKGEFDSVSEIQQLRRERDDAVSRHLSPLLRRSWSWPGIPQKISSL